MANTRRQNRQELAPLSNSSSRQVTPGLSRMLDDFLQSLGGVLIDITALEVNTMIVEQISGEKFIPWETYRDVYQINRNYLEQQEVHESLRERYIDLRRHLELEYTLLLTDPSSGLYDPTISPTDCPILINPSIELEQLQTHLPDSLAPTNSEDLLQVHRVLSDSNFLRSLRKIGELKAALDNRNKALLRREYELPNPVKPEFIEKSVKTDMIYAQTIIQLDGDIINRYSQQVFDHPHKDLILKVHEEGVIAGERQWRGLLEFVVGLVQSALHRGANINIFPGRTPK
ncbi:MAG: hypothetical protein KME06_07600 [Kastovskya adunca ATA6-11-RM4]|nr:hypothetical protein [Kastovskya adunca ATA6-11-RM4]